MVKKRSKHKFTYFHHSKLLSIVSCVGVVATAATAIHGTLKAKKVLDEANYIPSGDWRKDIPEEAKLVWKNYIAMDVAVMLSLIAIIANHKCTTKQLIAIGTFGAAAGRVFKDYENKIREKLGDEAFDDIRRSVAKDYEDRVQTAKISGGFPPSLIEEGFDVSIPTDTDTLYYDEFTNTWFRSNPAAVMSGWYQFNKEVISLGAAATLERFYGHIGVESEIDISRTGWGEEYFDGGFNWIDIRIDLSDLEDGSKYYIISYPVMPEDMTAELPYSYY